MKRFSWIPIAIFAAFGLVQAADQYRPNPYTGKPDNTGAFSQYSSELNKGVSVKNNSITAIGDSITYGSTNPATGWTVSVFNDFSSHYPRLNVSVNNKGMSGQSSDDILARLKADALDPSTNIVILMVGTNDSSVIPSANHVDISDYEANLRNIIRQVRARNKKLIIMVPPNVWEAGPTWSGVITAANLAPYQQKVIDLASELGIDLVDNRNIPTNGTYFNNDGIHPTAAGYTILYQNVMPALLRAYGYSVQSNTLAIGTNTPVSRFHVAEDSTTTPRGASMSQHSSDNNGFQLYFMKSRGTVDAPVATVGTEIAGAFGGQWYNGGSYVGGASMRFTATGAPATNTPSKVDIFTTDGTNIHTTITANSDGTTTTGGQLIAPSIKFSGDNTVQSTAVSVPGGAGAVPYSNGSGTLLSAPRFNFDGTTLKVQDLNLDTGFGTTPAFIATNLTDTSNYHALAASQGKALSDRSPVLTSGYVAFSDGSKYTGEAALNWDATNKRLGIGGAPATTLHIASSAAIATLSGSNNAGQLRLFYQNSTNTTPPGAADIDLGSIFMGGLDNVTARSGAKIGAASEAAWTYGSSHPTYLTFQTTPASSTTRAERLRVSSTGLTTFSNGGGLPYGQMYSNTSTTIPVAASGTWYEVDTGATDFTAGRLKNVTQTDHYLTAPTAGDYLINAAASFGTTTAGDEIALSVMINGTASATCHGHATVVTATTTVPSSCVTILTLAANDQVSLAVQNHSAARNITLSHSQLSILHVGSP